MEAKRTRDPRSLQDLDLRGEKAHRHGKTCLWAMTQPVHDTTGAHRVVLYLTENIWRAPEVRRWPRTWGKGWEGATNTKRWPALRQERSTGTVVFRVSQTGWRLFVSVLPTDQQGTNWGFSLKNIMTPVSSGPPLWLHGGEWFGQHKGVDQSELSQFKFRYNGLSQGRGLREQAVILDTKINRIGWHIR